jgi:hypothetical protein
MTTNNSEHLIRRITLVSLIFYGIGDILGAGIYGLVGKAAGLMGNGVRVIHVPRELPIFLKNLLVQIF